MVDTKDVERLAVVETKVDNLDKKVDGVDANVNNLHSKFDAFTEVFMPRREFDAKLDTVNTRITTIESDVKDIKDESKTNRHIKPVWISAAASVCAVGVAIWAAVK